WSRSSARARWCGDRERLRRSTWLAGSAPRRPDGHGLSGRGGVCHADAGIMRSIRPLFAALAALLLAVGLARIPAALAEPMHFFARPDNGLAATPPMGWNSWNHFACNVSASLIEGEADAMVASGMKAAGYRYVVIDDCWQVGRDANGNILADPQRFPQGIKPVADYVHGKGLKFGIYSDVGDHTCQMRPGSRGHEYQDALQYAHWGVDY